MSPTELCPGTSNRKSAPMPLCADPLWLGSLCSLGLCRSTASDSEWMLPGTVHSVHCAVAAAVLVSLTNHSHSRDDSVSCVRPTDVALDSINSSQLAVAQLFEVPPHTQQAGMRQLCSEHGWGCTWISKDSFSSESSLSSSAVLMERRR